MYSRLLRWEVFNFMSITHGICEFDDQNIINIKGYNDSGKSAMCTALRVLMCNSNPSKQVDFIQDDKDYFRVIAYFEDGVVILRDKYINGASLYEMHKDNQCIYTTKSSSGALTRVTEVPQPIANYLGLIVYDSICINIRSCFEKQIGVQSTGSENYKMFNTVLKSEELASAGELINSDRNKLQADINAYSSELNAQRMLLGNNGGLTKELVDSLKVLDGNLDITLSQESDLNLIVDLLDSIRILSEGITPELGIVDYKQLADLSLISNIFDELSGVVIVPELPVLDNEQLLMLLQINTISSGLSNISVLPELDIIDNSQLDLLSGILKLQGELSGVDIVPELPVVDTSQLSGLFSISCVLSELEECNNTVMTYINQLSEVNTELDNLQKQAEGFGIKMIKCPDCGKVFNPDDKAHVH